MSANPGGVTVDTQDPQVRRLLGLERGAQERWASEVERPAGIGPADRELVHLAGDEDAGFDSTIRLDGGKSEVYAHYKGRYTPPEFPDGLRLTLDVYAIPGEPVQVHLICPKCRHQLRVSSDRKAIDWQPDRGPDGGKLSIEPFQCTWEMPEAGAHTPGILAGGLSLCQWKGALEHKSGKNLVRDA